MCFFFFYGSGDHRDLPSFPTRRSSDLPNRRLRPSQRRSCCARCHEPPREDQPSTAPPSRHRRTGASDHSATEFQWPQSGRQGRSLPNPTRKAVLREVGAAVRVLNQRTLEQKIIALESQLAQIADQLGDTRSYEAGQKIKVLPHQRPRLVTELTPLENEWARRAEGMNDQ